MPIYGLEIGSKDGWGIFVAWSNGYWIAQTGKAYKFGYNFATLEQDYPWTRKSENPSFNSFPCARFLTQDKYGWNSTFLIPAMDLNPPSGIAMSLQSWDSDIVTVKVVNNSGSDWGQGYGYGLQALLKGVWYEVPMIPGHWAVPASYNALADGFERESSYSLLPYGDLPTGTYRLVVDGLSVVNTI